MSNNTLYIVDDDNSFLSALKWLFESINFEVKTFSNASEFLKQFSPKDRGILLTDLRMPGMNGLELLKKIKAEKSSLKVIIITAFGDIPMAIQAIKAGANDFIVKPINEKHLSELVQKCTQENIPDTLDKNEILTESELRFLESIWKEE